MNLAATVPLQLTLLLHVGGGMISLVGLFWLLIGLVLSLVALGIGIVIGVVLLAMAGLLVSAGIVSSSVVAGLVTGRVSTGWRTFLILSSVCALTVFGAAAGWLAERASSVDLVPSWAVLAGAGAGAMAGVFGALCFDWLLRLAARRAAALRHAPWMQRLTQRFFPRFNNTNRIS